MRKLLFTQLLMLGIFCSGQNKKALFLDGKQIETLEYQDTLSLGMQATQYVESLWSGGHLFAGIDSADQGGVFIHKGDKIDLFTYNTLVSLSQLLANANKELQDKHNNGHPFAKLKWDSIQLMDSRLTLKKVIELGPYIQHDSVVLLSAIKTKRTFIAKTLGMPKGTPFNESAFVTINNRLKRISFLETKQEPDISFQSGSAWTYLDLTENRTGSFEGVLGILPSQSVNDKVLITGNLNLTLLNLFGSGKELDFSWQRFGEESQILDIRHKQPFFLGSNIHVEGSFGLVKQDTSFITQNLGLVTSFFLKDQLELGFVIDQSNGTVVTTNSSEIIRNNFHDFRQNVYSFSLSRPVEIIQAKADFGFHAKVGVGERTISINNNLPRASYDTVDLKTTNLILEGGVQFQTMFSKRSAIYGGLSIAHQSTVQAISNQLFRLGGLKTLRGFNEQFFFASSYVVNQLEWRLYFEERSFLFGFFDQGFLKIENWSVPLGLGGGFSLDTKAGLLSFALAVGKTKDLPFEFTNMKVHFGYLSRF